MGPVIVDIEGTTLTNNDIALLRHDNVSGVILFARNYQSLEQLKSLTAAIRATRPEPIAICVDQEGGRVQRFRDGFTRIPAANTFQHHPQGEQLAYLAGWVMATELVAAGVDFSFAPVLDVGEASKAIGTRSFGPDAATVLKFASQYIKGMKDTGMITTGKHFPGHGGVIADSHLETPYDHRQTITTDDMRVFSQLIERAELDAIMPAHVVYPHYDDKPASGSEYWLKTVLRGDLAYKGLIFSDDLNMKGADILGGYVERGQKALAAGCDLLLLCNNPQGLTELVQGLEVQKYKIDVASLVCSQREQAIAALSSQAYKEAVTKLEKLN